MALTTKPIRKYLYLRLVKILGLYDDVVWHASSWHEENDIRRWFGSGLSGTKAPILVAPDLPPKALFLAQAAFPRKARGSLRLIFAARITPVKNLRRSAKMSDWSSGSGRIRYLRERG